MLHHETHDIVVVKVPGHKEWVRRMRNLSYLGEQEYIPTTFFILSKNSDNLCHDHTGIREYYVTRITDFTLKRQTNVANS